MNELKFLKGTKEGYDSIENKEKDAIYFANSSSGKTELHLDDSTWSSDEIIYDEIKKNEKTVVTTFGKVKNSVGLNNNFTLPSLSDTTYLKEATDIVNGLKTLDDELQKPRIISGSQTTTSTADGGNNIFTFTKSDGTTANFTVKNGKKGSNGVSVNSMLLYYKISNDNPGTPSLNKRKIYNLSNRDIYDENGRPTQDQNGVGIGEFQDLAFQRTDANFVYYSNALYSGLRNAGSGPRTFYINNVKNTIIVRIDGYHLNNDIELINGGELVSKSENWIEIKSLGNPIELRVARYLDYNSSAIIASISYNIYATIDQAIQGEGWTTSLTYTPKDNVWLMWKINYSNDTYELEYPMLLPHNVVDEERMTTIENNVNSLSGSTILKTEKGKVNGVASLDETGRVPSSQLPSILNNVIQQVIDQKVVGNDDDYVDLGLPSGLKWAKCNVGASSEEEAGLYFQWGDTVGYTDASHSTWKTCPFNNGSSSYDKEYFASVSGEACPNGVLASQYDAAYQASNGEMRMPTKAEFDELLANTNKEWVTNFNDSGVNGYKFTSKTNGNSIFIPAVGYADNGFISKVGDTSYVLSSSLYTSQPNLSWNLISYSYGMRMDYGYRYSGRSVRGVLENPTPLTPLRDLVNGLEENKVDKVNGKGLSTEDFTTELKNKLEGLENYDDSELRNEISTVSGDVITIIEDNEKVTAFALNELNDRLDIISEQISNATKISEQILNE